MADPATILIVEDEAIIALDLRETLSDLGHQVLATVASGEEALLLAEAARPDLILMDIRLAGAMSGLDAARQIRERFGIPSLFLTSYADRELLDKAKSVDALGYLLKPFDDRSLAIHLEMALHHATHQRRPSIATTAEMATGLPCMEIRSLGGFSLTLGERILHGEDFSRTQRELIALLLSSPHLRITREEIELGLWPDSPPDRARSSFDSLLLRLRKTLQAGLDSNRIKDYLLFQKGILTLENCQIDTQIFLAGCNKALQRAKHADPTATALLCDALSLWQGEFMPGICGSERIDLYRQELRRTHVAVSRQFAALLVREGKVDKATLCLQQCALIDPGNDELIGELYRLLLQGHQLAQARQLLRQYSEQLHAAGFARVEIVAALRCITDPAGEPQ